MDKIDGDAQEKPELVEISICESDLSIPQIIQTGSHKEILNFLAEEFKNKTFSFRHDGKADDDGIYVISKGGLKHAMNKRDEIYKKIVLYRINDIIHQVSFVKRPTRDGNPDVICDWVGYARISINNQVFIGKITIEKAKDKVNRFHHLALYNDEKA